MSKPTILKNKIVGEFSLKDSKEAQDRICYLYLESNRKLNLTVSGQNWSLLLPLPALRAFVNRAYHEVGKEDKKEVRVLKTKYSIGKPLFKETERPTGKGKR